MTHLLCVAPLSLHCPAFLALIKGRQRYDWSGNFKWSHLDASWFLIAMSFYCISSAPWFQRSVDGYPRRSGLILWYSWKEKFFKVNSALNFTSSTHEMLNNRDLSSSCYVMIVCGSLVFSLIGLRWCHLCKCISSKTSTTVDTVFMGVCDSRRSGRLQIRSRKFEVSAV